MGNICGSGSKSGGYRPVDAGLTDTQIPKGCRVNLLKQDPSVHHLKPRTVWIPANFEPGPATSDIIVRMNAIVVKPTDAESNDYLYDLDKNPEEFDVVNAFTIVHQVLTMYRRALKRIGVTKPLEWHWGSTPIRLFPRFMYGENAFYIREHKALAFYYFDDPSDKSMTIYTCRSYDVVSHETGHAVLDSLQPQYLESKNPQTGALHEAFGDMTAIFALLNQMDICEHVIAIAKGDLHKQNFLHVFAEEFGSGLGLGIGLRNADNDLTLDDVSDQVHSLSRVFTGAVYNILVDMFEVCRDTKKDDPAETLYRVGEELTGIFLRGLVNAPSVDASFSAVANEMMKATKETAFKNIMKKEFEKRKIFDKKASANMVEAHITEELVKECCATMSLQYNEPGRKSVSNVVNYDLKMFGDYPEPVAARALTRTDRRAGDADRDAASRSILETDSMKWIDATPAESMEDLKANNAYAGKSSKQSKKGSDKKGLLRKE